MGPEAEGALGLECRAEWEEWAAEEEAVATSASEGRPGLDRLEAMAAAAAALWAAPVVVATRAAIE